MSFFQNLWLLFLDCLGYDRPSPVEGSPKTKPETVVIHPEGVKYDERDERPTDSVQVGDTVFHVAKDDGHIVKVVDLPVTPADEVTEESSGEDTVDPQNPVPGLRMVGPHGGPREVVGLDLDDPDHDYVEYVGKDGKRIRKVTIQKWRAWAETATVESVPQG